MQQHGNKHFACRPPLPPQVPDRWKVSTGQNLTF